jgi:acyl transferase domain-containing protein
VEALVTRDPKRVVTGQSTDDETPVVFMFPSQGAQHVNMTREIYDSEALFREQVDRCCDLLKPHLELDLRTILYLSADQSEEAAHQLAQTFITQPALFVAEYALGQLWMSWGVRPQAMIGHSIGEYVAACLANVFTLEDALSLVAARGRLVQRQPGGAMLAIRLPEHETKPLLGRKLSLAAVNGPALCVASGPFDAIEGLEKKLHERHVACRRLQTSHAVHSEMMDPVLHVFMTKVRKARLNAPQIPYVSNLTGQWITPPEATNPNYWAAHLRQTVRFADGLAELARGQKGMFLELGPGRALTTLARQHPAASASHVIASLGHAKGQPLDQASMLSTLGRLWLAGLAVPGPGFYAQQRRHRLPLPTYPFERTRYWVEPTDLGERDSPVPRTAAPGLAEPSTGEQKKSQKHAGLQFDTAPTGRREDDRLTDMRAVFQELSGSDLSEASGSAPSREFETAPHTSASRALAEVLGGLPGIKPVGIHDISFESCGHSRLITRWVRSSSCSCRCAIVQAPATARMHPVGATPARRAAN